MIQNLEDFTGLKVLWLEGNGLHEISGLSGQTDMRTLYLQENVIEAIENLDHMVRNRFGVYVSYPFLTFMSFCRRNWTL